MSHQPNELGGNNFAIDQINELDDEESISHGSLGNEQMPDMFEGELSPKIVIQTTLNSEQDERLVSVDDLDDARD